jgi:GTP:adenosylcobinamide-phosphate guanylyltransferase
MYDAVILAGSPNTGPLAECSGENYEAMIKIGDKPMVRYVVDALLDSKLINKIAISGPKELADFFPEDSVSVIEPEGTVIGNALKALKVVDATKPVIISTCDIPLLTAEAVIDFIKLCQGKKADFFYPIVSMKEASYKFPGVKRTSAKIKEGTFTGGNIFFLNQGLNSSVTAKAQEFVNFRKSPLKLCKLLGFKFVFKLLFRRLSIPELEAKVSEVLGLKVKAVITLFPEIGIDVDKPSDYSIVSRFLGKPD